MTNAWRAPQRGMRDQARQGCPRSTCRPLQRVRRRQDHLAVHGVRGGQGLVRWRLRLRQVRPRQVPGPQRRELLPGLRLRHLQRGRGRLERQRVHDLRRRDLLRLRRLPVHQVRCRLRLQQGRPVQPGQLPDLHEGLLRARGLHHLPDVHRVPLLRLRRRRLLHQVRCAGRFNAHKTGCTKCVAGHSSAAANAGSIDTCVACGPGPSTPRRAPTPAPPATVVPTAPIYSL